VNANHKASDSIQLLVLVTLTVRRHNTNLYSATDAQTHYGIQCNNTVQIIGQ